MNKRTGFTLVELAIVFIIIGLLIGGILVASSMVDTAKAEKLVKDLQQFSIATVNFQTAYKATPGDAKNFSPAGNGNGIIEDSSGTGTSNTFTGEVANYWVHLSAVGFKPKGVTLSAIPTANGITAGFNVPEVSYGIRGTGAVVVNGAFVSNATGTTNDGNNYYMLLGLPSGAAAGANITGLPAFTVNQATAIDLKIDDGKPGTGSVKADAGNGGCLNGSSYNSSYSPTTPACNLYIKNTFTQ